MSSGFFNQRSAAAFERHLDVAARNKTITFRFPPSDFFDDTVCLIMNGCWETDEDGNYLIETRFIESLNIQSEADKNGERITESGRIIRVSLRPFPKGIPDEDWLNCTVLYTPDDAEEPKEYFCTNRPLAQNEYYTVTIRDRQQVFDDTPGAGGGRERLR